jgi:prephenate dehydrogenase
MDTVAIVGVGLIGASFGLALRKAGFEGRILGVSSPPALQDALLRGAIDLGLPLAEAVPQADLVFLAQPICRILTTIRKLDSLLKPGALVTDAGSTKSVIVEAGRNHIHRGQFLGGHPMAGKEKRGAAAAEAGLFAGRTWVLTPASPAALDTAAVQELRNWIAAIGAREVVLDPEEHDRVVAFTSHLPQLASTALAATVAKRILSPEHLQVAGPGLADTTRLAGSSYEIWGDILETNGAAIAAALDVYISQLEEFRAHLRDGGLRDEFEAANAFVTELRRRN